ncbi:uncharacterized protein BJ171DRAFT_90035, partial [Polychytrium aggregatum]|uniref:uncharacterized protein n=1 Tax=Polychytrium aggregatum TaxID=110093 RepID=UPI0022FE711C
ATGRTLIRSLSASVLGLEVSAAGPRCRPLISTFESPPTPTPTPPPPLRPVPGMPTLRVGFRRVFWILVALVGVMSLIGFISLRDSSSDWSASPYLFQALKPAESPLPTEAPASSSLLPPLDEDLPEILPPGTKMTMDMLKLRWAALREAPLHFTIEHCTS